MIVIRREYLRQRAVLITILLCVILPLCLRIIYNYKYEFVVLRGKIKANPSFRPLREVLAVDASLKKRHNSELEPLVVIYMHFSPQRIGTAHLGQGGRLKGCKDP